jgi:hypothetical protein
MLLDVNRRDNTYTWTEKRNIQQLQMSSVGYRKDYVHESKRRPFSRISLMKSVQQENSSFSIGCPPCVRLQALGVPPVSLPAGASGLAALRASEFQTAALGILDCALLDGGTGRSGGCRGGGSGGDLHKGRGGGRRTAAASGAVPNGGSREGEGLETSVDAEFRIVVGSLVGAGELDERTRGAVAAASYLDLNAGDEVLGLVDVGPVNA